MFICKEPNLWIVVQRKKYLYHILIPNQTHWDLWKFTNVLLWKINATTFSHCSKSSFFVQKFNFDFTRKIVKKSCVKNSWKCWGFVKIEFLDKNLTFRKVCIIWILDFKLRLDVYISCFIIWIRAMCHRIVLWSHKRQKFILTGESASLNYSFVRGRNKGHSGLCWWTSWRNITLLIIITIFWLESDHWSVFLQLANIRSLHKQRLGTRSGWPRIRLLAFWPSLSWNCSFAVAFRSGRPAMQLIQINSIKKGITRIYLMVSHYKRRQYYR